MSVDERGSLIGEALRTNEKSTDAASQLSPSLGKVILATQALLVIVLSLVFQYESADFYSTQKYIVFRDIMVMLLLGFGYCKYKVTLVDTQMKNKIVVVVVVFMATNKSFYVSCSMA
jgi:hypothetical protein